ncbi:MAG: ATP-binding cassette domain-containing protein, partial [Clostridia bacterium]|nr:ATP-binding cassette domain-containing protein [Clostridia bacterium]
SGKSTLLRLSAGIEKPDSGTIVCGDGLEPEPLSHEPSIAASLDAPSAWLAYMPQKPYLFSRSVYANAILGITEQKDHRDLALKALESLDLIALQNKNAKTLSGGEAQRLALLRTLLVRKPFYLLDEPFSAQDPGHLSLSERYTRDRIHTFGATLFFTTHHLPSAEHLADVILNMEDGRIVTVSS